MNTGTPASNNDIRKNPRQQQPRGSRSGSYSRQIAAALIAAFALAIVFAFYATAEPPEAHAQENTPTVIWSASLQVGALANVVGYKSIIQTGSLSNTSFEYKGETATVTQLATSELEGNTELFLNIENLFTNPSILTNWTLHIGTETFTGDSCTNPTLNTDECRWSTIPTWSAGNTVAVKITTTEPSAPRQVGARDISYPGTKVRLRWITPETPVGPP